VLIYFSTPTLSTSILKTTANDDEKLINEVMLYGFDDQGAFVEKYLEEDISASGIKRVIKRDIKTFYAIANPGSSIKEIPQEYVSNVSKLMKLTADFTCVTQQNILMSGKGDVSKYSANIPLVRAVAKVEFLSYPDDDFLIESASVKSAPDKGYVFKQDELSVPVDATMVPYESVSSTQPIYVAENSTSKPTQFVVSGTFEGKPASYSFELKDKGGQNIDIRRNTHYKVYIKPIDEKEGSITVTIPDWDFELTQTHEVPVPKPYQNGIKILAIGNSFSNNSMWYMYDLLKQLGIDSTGIKLVNASISSGSLCDHVISIKGDYSKLRRITHERAWGNYKEDDKGLYTLEYMIKQADWDVITLQQVSDSSFISSSYQPYLDYLIGYVATHAKNPECKLVWHMTWSYDQSEINKSNTLKTNYTNPYGLWNAISGVVQSVIVPKLKINGGVFDFIIPTGTAIQNARYHYGDILTPDGRHLNNLGRYIAGAMWVKSVTGYDIAKLKVPYRAENKDDGITSIIKADDLEKIIQAVNAADASPFTAFNKD